MFNLKRFIKIKTTYNNYIFFHYKIKRKFILINDKGEIYKIEHIKIIFLYINLVYTYIPIKINKKKQNIVKHFFIL
jgi:hypothetical protein